jgi:hypothetical protein
VSAILKAIRRPWLVLPTIIRKTCGWLDDERYIKAIYYLRNGKKLNLKDPVTYFEKINWIKLHDRRPIYTTMVDKYEVKKLVSEKLGEQYVIPTLGVYESVDEIDIDLLPDQFVLKCTHDGGSTFICRDKKTFDIEAVKKSLKKCLNRNYYKLSREWPYKDVKPRIICEPYLAGIVDKNYKFFCFDGKMKFLYVAPFRESTSDYFDEDYVHIDGIHNVFHNCAPTPPSKPDSFEEMKALAEKLSKGYPEMRVDFYDDNGRIYFGEITFFQEGGFAPWIPDEWNYTFGEYIKLPPKQ